MKAFEPTRVVGYPVHAENYTYNRKISTDTFQLQNHQELLVVVCFYLYTFMRQTRVQKCHVTNNSGWL